MKQKEKRGTNKQEQVKQKEKRGTNKQEKEKKRENRRAKEMPVKQGLNYGMSKG